MWTRCDVATGHAIINVDRAGENAIVLFAGANRALWVCKRLRRRWQRPRRATTLVMQNETAHQPEAARIAQAKGLQVVYSAAPFEVEAVRAVLPYVTLLLLNAVEAAQLCEALNVSLQRLAVPQVLVTHGARGAVLHDIAAAKQVEVARVSRAGRRYHWGR